MSAFGAFALLGSRCAWAQSVASPSATAARAAYDAGAHAFKEGRFSEAGSQFDQAARIVPSAVALFTAGLAWERASEFARAADDFARAIGLPGLTELQVRKASERLIHLEKALGTVRVSGPAGSSVRVDDGQAVAIPSTVHTSGGPHVVEWTKAHAPTDGSPAVLRRSVLLVEGQTLEINFDSMVAAPRPLIPARVEAGPSRTLIPSPNATRLIAGSALLGAGTVGEIVAAVLWWGNAVPASIAYKRQPSQAALDKARTFETWTNVTLIGGATLLAGGAACLLLPIKGAWPQSGSLGIALDPAPARIRLLGTF